MFQRTRHFAFAGLVLCLSAPAVQGEPPLPERADQEAAETKTAKKKPTKFIRLVRDSKDRPKSLDTAIVRYVPDEPGDREGLKVDLISAVHIGEKSYYEKLNKEFENYDVLLYELVAPEGTKVPKGGGTKRSGLSSVQGGLKDMLELEFQLEHVDYDKENFVHADMSPDEFAASMTERGETVWTMLFRMMGQSILQQSKQSDPTSDLDMLAALFSENRAMALKRVMAEQFDDVESAMEAFEGPEGSTILSARNKVALEVLAEKIAEGYKSIGIFYGGAHLAGMEVGLIEEFDLKVQDERWVVAWDLRDKAKEKAKRKKPDRSKPKEAVPAGE